MRILHTADVHLDRAYSGAGMTSSIAAARRQELREALRRFVDLALELRVDVVTIGGDLYEHERSTLDTGNFLAAQFARLGDIPVLIATGNHDPCVPDSLYRRAAWPANVHIFGEPTFKAFALPVAAHPEALEGAPNTSPLAPITLWSAGHDRPDLRDNLLDNLQLPEDGTHILLFHGSDTHAVPEGKPVHAGFRPEDIARTGATFALLGHYHSPSSWVIRRGGQALTNQPVDQGPRPDSPVFAYPGSPEPLDFSEAGDHFVLLLDVGDGVARAELLPFGEVRYATQRLDVSDATSSDDLRAAVCAMGDRNTIVRLILEGQLQPDVDLDLRALYNACAERFKFLDLVDRTEPAYDYDELAGESTTKGAFVRLMRARIASLALSSDSPSRSEEREAAELALRMGLQAFERREVVVP